MQAAIHQLKKGEYLAPQYDTFDFGDFLVSKTNYANPVTTGKWHRHERPMISLVLSGGNLERREHTSINRVSGSANFYHAFELHRNDYKAFPSTHIGLELETQFLRQHEVLETTLEKSIQTRPTIKFTFLKMLKEASLNDDHAKSSVQMLFLSLIDIPEKTYRKTFPIWMKKVLDILQGHWNRTVTLEMLAAETNVHPITIAKRFKECFKCTLGEYLRASKVEHALELLQSGQYSLGQVAYQCGFSDQSHFTRIFKSYTGFLPKDFLKI